MKAVGLRELKNRLSEYVREVRGGEIVLVTDRGEVVAELGPPRADQTASSVPAAVQALARRGAATLGRADEPHVYRSFSRALNAGRASRLLDAERGER